MSNIGEPSIQNFQSLIENYESTIKEITNELDEFQVEQASIRKKITGLLDENNRLSSEFNTLLSDRSSSEIEHQFVENDFIENLKEQLKTVINEKEYAIKLWQNAAQTVDFLEEELKIYQDNSEGFIPKTEFSKIKIAYEEKVKALEEALVQSQHKLEETINLTSKELQIKEKEIYETQHSQDNTFKIIKNLEEEVLKLQERLNDSDRIKNQLEKSYKNKIEEIEFLKVRNRECCIKVEEALQVVEAALNEKDASLLRENDAKEEIRKLSKHLAEVISASEEKIRTELNSARINYEKKLEKVVQDLNSSKEDLKVKVLETEKYSRECVILNNEIQKLKKGHLYTDESNVSKLLVLEKNLENTFQKLLLSEKQNIQINSEKESIKNDLEQMSRYYERDVQARETEKIVLKSEIKKLQIELEETNLKLIQNSETVVGLYGKIEENESNFQKQMEETKNLLQKNYSEKITEVRIMHDQLISEFQEQLSSQIEINKKWRIETRNVIEKLEKRLVELKIELNKIKSENKALTEKLKQANSKIYEYRKFLQVISKDVNKITNIGLPDKVELDR